MADFRYYLNVDDEVAFRSLGGADWFMREIAAERKRLSELESGARAVMYAEWLERYCEVGEGLTERAPALVRSLTEYATARGYCRGSAQANMRFVKALLMRFFLARDRRGEYYEGVQLRAGRDTRERTISAPAAVPEPADLI